MPTSERASPSLAGSDTPEGTPILAGRLSAATPWALAALAAAIAAGLVGSGRIALNSDQAMVGLMAQDIQQGKHPVFFYGSEYGGTLEPHLLAVLFRLFGASESTFRLLTGGLFVASVLVVWAYTRRAFGARAALFAALYLIAGPPFFLYRMLTSDGEYASLFLLLAIALWLLSIVAERLAGARPAAAACGLLGFVIGLAWWQLPLAACLAGPLAVVPFPGRSRWRARHYATAGVGFLGGCFPWLVHNLRTHFLSLRIPEVALTSPARALAHAAVDARAQWAILLGILSPATSGRYFDLSTTLALGVLALLVAVGIRAALRGDTPERRATSLRLLLLLLANQLLVVAIARGSEPIPRTLPPAYLAASRYLLPGLLAIAPLFGLLVAVSWRRPLARLAVLAAWVSLTAASYLVSSLPPKPDTEALISRLEAIGTPPFYASYWTAYRVTFLSGRRLIASPLGNGTNGFARHRELAALVDASPSPALLLDGSDRDSFRAFAATHPGGRATELGRYTLFSQLPPDTLTVLRRCRCIPQLFRAGEVDWRQIGGPRRLRQGDRATFPVVLRILGREAISPNLHLSYHWRRSSDGVVVVYNGLRSALTDVVVVDGAQTVRVAADVLADVPPGDYRLELVLVDENVAWQDESGVAAPPYAVTVTPR